MNKALIFSIALIMTGSLVACDSSPSETASETIKSQSSLNLPTGLIPVTLSGAIESWFVEGEAGCYASLNADDETVELYSEISACDNIEYEKGQQVTIDIIFREYHQYAPDEYEVYTIAKF